MKVHSSTTSEATELIISWAKNKEARYVCVANVHMSVECADSESYRSVVNSADLIVADGKPLSVLQRARGLKGAEQVRGEDLVLNLCEAATRENLRIGFYGATEQTLEKLKLSLISLYPKIDISYIYSPPFSSVVTGTSANQFGQFKNGGDVDFEILFVGLGCPKQEIWMHENSASINAPLIGVGAAFDFISGTKKSAPKLLSKLGMEWLFRLACEPRRLFKRYFKSNLKFASYLITNLASNKEI